MSNMKPAHTAKPEMKLSMPAVKRLLAYLKQYKAVLVIVTVCILLSAGATAASSLFLQVLIDQYIMPLLAETNPVFTGLLRALMIIASIYGVGVLCSWIYSRLMINVAQRTLKRIRDEMFGKMQSFPIRYFRHAYPRRYYEPLHQRYRHAPADDYPVDAAAGFFRVHDCDGILCDAVPERVLDGYCCRFHFFNFESD